MRDALLGQTFYLDANIIIFAVEKGNPWGAALGDLFSMIDNQTIRTFTSELTLAEVLAKPLAVGSANLVIKYEQMLAEDGIIDVLPVSRHILRMSADFRGRFGVKLADAIHLATARHVACDFVLTNDRDLGRKMGTEFKWLSLADLSATPSSD